MNASLYAMATIVETRDLSRRYGSTLALDHLTFQIPEGSIFGFIGPNGAGKTTTMRILTTMLQPSGGQAWVRGMSVVANPVAVRTMIGYMPDFFGVYDTMKSWEYLDFFGRAYKIAPGRRATLIGELLEIVDLSHKRDDYVMNLSRGMKQRLSLARAMMHDPGLLILDEPASGLDPRARIELRELLKELRSLGKTIMVSSHILTELAEMCTHIAIIERGRLLASGDVQTILRSLQPHRTLEVRVLEDAAGAIEILKNMPNVQAVQLATDGSEVSMASDPDTPMSEAQSLVGPQTLLVDYAGDERGMAALLERLVNAGVAVMRFAEQHSDLEDIFMQVTQGLVQ